MIMDDYWKFIFGVQYNANLFFNNEIEYHQIKHEWSSFFCDVFLVRDYATNTLLYDSIDGLVIGLFQQHFKSCSLYPFELLFDESGLNQKIHFDFPIYNYPVAVFKSMGFGWIALIQINEKLKSKEIHPLGDPREFCGVSSSQRASNNQLFTLIRLNEAQEQKAQAFDQHLDWMSYFNHIKANFLENRFNYIDDSGLLIAHNLFIEYHGEKKLSEEDDNPNNLAFSLLQRCIHVYECLSQLHTNYHERPPYPDFIDSHTEQYVEFTEQFETAIINLICHTANDYKNAKVKTKFIPIQKNKYITYEAELEPNIDEFNEDSTEIETLPQKNPDLPITGMRAITTLLILFIVIFLIVYGLFWMMRQYELAKITVITTGLIILLYLWSKK
ncbi:hypothetical protein AMD27_02750 [Acinetobacter sp. TGL-Y2]|nr:hypothetical protein AMD27_02750 [Acinetobacter sp. TGL-Y2]